jgi:hypothetical protein
MIRFEITLTAVCDECGTKWSPTGWTGLDNVQHIEPPECPKCAEARQKAGKLLRYFPDDEVIDLLN